MLVTILVVILVLALIGALPHWGWGDGANWGYGPSGVIGLLLIVLLVVWALGVLPTRW